MRSRGTWSRKGGVTVLVIATVMSTGAAFAASRALHSIRADDGAPAVATPSMQQRRAVLAGSVSFVPKANANDVAPDAPVVVSTATGWLSNVRVASADGHALSGKLDVTGRHWLAVGAMQAGSPTAFRRRCSTGRVRLQTSSSQFRTLTVTTPVTATLFPSDGMTTGHRAAGRRSLRSRHRLRCGAGERALAHHRDRVATGHRRLALVQRPRAALPAACVLAGRRARHGRVRTSTVGTPATDVGEWVRKSCTSRSATRTFPWRTSQRIGWTCRATACRRELRDERRAARSIRR